MYYAYKKNKKKQKKKKETQDKMKKAVVQVKALKAFEDVTKAQIYWTSLQKYLLESGNLQKYLDIYGKMTNAK